MDASQPETAALAGADEAAASAASAIPAEPAPALAPAAAPPGWRQRARLPLMLLGVLVVAGIAAGVYLSGGRYVGTDDAYVKTARVPISADVAGRVVELAVHDNQPVHRGDLLYRLDDAPYRIAVQEAEAQLASARLQVEALKANYRQRQTELASARDTVAFQQREAQRQRRLLVSGIASQSQVDRATHAYDDALASTAGAQQSIGAIVAQLGGKPDLPVARHPSVQQAQAVLDRARLNLSYTVVRAPADGVVTQVEQLQVGSYVAASAPVFALVQSAAPWLEANFKEDQLAHMRVGQRATVHVDSYPGKVFEGRVASVSPGTGSQFSALPPENATGNWVKVVQRLPVRIELDQPADAAWPLQGGLSATVDVDTGYERHLFGASTPMTPVAATPERQAAARP
jgi:membrane fusion protein (multidrug efflux system)